MRIIDAPALMPKGIQVRIVRDDHAVKDADALLRSFALEVDVKGWVDLEAAVREGPRENEQLVVCSPDWFSLAGLLERGNPSSDPLILLVPEAYPWGYLDFARSLHEWPDVSYRAGVNPLAARGHLTRPGKIRLDDGGAFESADPDTLKLLRDRADRKALAVVRDRLADEESRAVLDRLLSGSLAELFTGYVQRVFRGVQYLDCGIFFPGMVIIDGGIQEGFELPYYVAHTGCDVELVCVDPSGLDGLGSFALAAISSGRVRTRVVGRALWSDSGCVSLPVSDTGAVLSQFKGHKTRFQDVTFECITVDDLVAAQDLPHVDLIKLDIEGAEPEVLRGMDSTLARHRPQLAISIYHWPEHMWEIPLRLMNRLDDYDFHLRHYSYGRWECILYAIPRPGSSARLDARRAIG